MRRRRLFHALGLCVGLGSSVLAAERDGEIPLLVQPPAQPATPPPPPTRPQTTPPTRPTTPPSAPVPPSTTPPGLTTPPTLAPVSSPFGAAPPATSAAGFTPYMMGDLPASSYICGLVCFPTLVPVTIPQPPPPPPPPPPQGTPQRQSPPPGAFPGQGTVTQPQPGAVAAAVAAGRPGQTVFVPGTACRYVLIPQVGRGAVKIEENESPLPVDRVYVTYDYFDNVGAGVPGLPGSNLHRETYGFEWTYLGGDASVGLRMNSLQTTGDSTYASGDFGDLTVINKFALVNDRATGNVLSVGLAVTAPTGPDAVLPNGARLNPVLLQPFSGFIYNWDRLYAQGFSSLIVPTDSRDALISTASLGLGYYVYRAADPAALVTYLTPVVEGHATIPLNHRGLDQTLVGFPDVFVLTNGVHIGLGSRSNLAVGVAVPLTGPKIFDVEAIAQLNWRF